MEGPRVEGRMGESLAPKRATGRFFYDKKGLRSALKTPCSTGLLGHTKPNRRAWQGLAKMFIFHAFSIDRSAYQTPPRHTERMRTHHVARHRGTRTLRAMSLLPFAALTAHISRHDPPPRRRAHCAHVASQFMQYGLSHTRHRGSSAPQYEHTPTNSNAFGWCTAPVDVP